MKKRKSIVISQKMTRGQFPISILRSNCFRSENYFVELNLAPGQHATKEEIRIRQELQGREFSTHLFIGHVLSCLSSQALLFIVLFFNWTKSIPSFEQSIQIVPIQGLALRSAFETDSAGKFVAGRRFNLDPPSQKQFFVAWVHATRKSCLDS